MVSINADDSLNFIKSSALEFAVGDRWRAPRALSPRVQCVIPVSSQVQEKPGLAEYPELISKRVIGIQPSPMHEYHVQDNPD